MLNSDNYLWFYKDPLMPSPNFWYLGVRTQNAERTLIMCNECGKFFKRIHTKHLVKHWLTMEQYREKYGYQKSTAMCADQESINISKKILWKTHSIQNNREALKKRAENHAKSTENGKWKNRNGRQNEFWTCHDQIGERLRIYLERFWRPPTYSAMWEDWGALYSLLRNRYGSVNDWFKEYGLPIKHLIPWECVEYHFSDSTIIKVWYKHDNREQLYAKIKSTCSLFKNVS